jgi:hypothetical protein
VSEKSIEHTVIEVKPSDDKPLTERLNMMVQNLVISSDENKHISKLIEQIIQPPKQIPHQQSKQKGEAPVVSQFQPSKVNDSKRHS